MRFCPKRHRALLHLSAFTRTNQSSHNCQSEGSRLLPWTTNLGRSKVLDGLASFPCTLPHEKARSITARPPPWPAPRNPASVSEEGERPLKRRSSKLACLPSDDRGKGVVENDQNVSCSMGPLPLPKHSQYGGITQCRNAVVAPAQLAYRITTLRHETSARESAAGRHHGSRHTVDGFRCVRAW